MIRSPFLGRAASLAAVGALSLCVGAAAMAASPSLRGTGLTFVASRASANEMVLRARRAVLFPETDIAHLEEVRVTIFQTEKHRRFEMTCDRGELNIETNDFVAEGHVEGVTDDGQRYTAPWVRYDHERDLLYTDAPAVMVDGKGTFRGDGFRFHVGERRFRLIGNVNVVQMP